MKNIILAAGLLFAGAGWAQQEDHAGKQFEGENRLIVFRIVPGDKSARLYLVGKKVGEVDFRKDVKVLSITAFSGGKKEELRFKENGDSYTVTPFPQAHDLSLSLKAEVRGKQEEIKLKGRP